MIKYKEVTQSRYRAFIVLFKEKWTELLIEEAEKQQIDYHFEASDNIDFSDEVLLNLVNLNVVMRNVADDLIYQAITDFIVLQKRNIHNNPSVYIGKCDRNGFEAVIDLEISPLVKLADYKDLNVLTPLNFEKEDQERYKENLLIALFEESEIIVNEDLLEEEMQNAMNSTLKRYGSKQSYQDFIQNQNIDFETHMAELKEDTIFRVSIQTLLYEIASLENVTLTVQDVTKTKENISAQFGINIQQVQDFFDSDYIHNRALLEKTTKLIIDLNKGKKLLN